MSKLPTYDTIEKIKSKRSAGHTLHDKSLCLK